ncbi:MAG: hypothetical protein IKX63_07305 [Muribaculaceae bacterium]|nr:hypothetical protein [Muribaculaceae bacterium]
MWFFLLILLILALFFFSPAVRVWRAVRKFQNDYNQAMEDAQQKANEANTTSSTNEMKERYRRYTTENGEYVNYEELEGRPQQHDETENAPSGASSSAGSKYQEEIVSDAEFEDIE